jgi:molybdopterin converting factor small subunit
MIMKITVKLMPPYRKKGDQGEYLIELDAERLNLEYLAGYLNDNHRDLFGFTLIDERGLLTAEFIVNGRSASLTDPLAEGDMVTIFPYICGG